MIRLSPSVVTTLKPTNLVPAIRASLEAKLDRLLSRPLIAELAAEEDGADLEGPPAFVAMRRAARRVASAWVDDREGGTATVEITIDYDHTWHGQEKEVRDIVTRTVDSTVVFLTNEQRRLLERSPRELLEPTLKLESAELISFEVRKEGGVERVVSLTVAQPPELRDGLRHVAVLPNLVPLQRQQEALSVIEAASDEGPLAPLRALVGLCSAAALSRPGPAAELAISARLDASQRGCVQKAVDTPHFCLLHGPPGSGKTTVITEIVRQELLRGGLVLVVSPTHVAADNVVEKLTTIEDAQDVLADHTLPLRFAARPKKLSPAAMPYWVGGRGEHRAATISGRLQRAIERALPDAAQLYAAEDEDEPGVAPLSAAFARTASVLCGTPLGILSMEAVQSAQPGSFELLIVDEVSKMPMAEFLAIAVKAKRWVLVGDPEQLPPFNDMAENAVTLDDLLPRELELACSVAAHFERVRPGLASTERVVVVATDPDLAAAAIRAHLGEVFGTPTLTVGLVDDADDVTVRVCTVDERERACRASSRATRRLHTGAAECPGTTWVLVERGIPRALLPVDGGTPVVDERRRAQAVIFDRGFSVYHSQPWAARRGKSLPVVEARRGLAKVLPTRSAMGQRGQAGERDLGALHEEIARRFAVNTVSVFDWIAGMPVEHFDVAPLSGLQALQRSGLQAVTGPFVATLELQYRMHPSLSRLPREMFYGGRALKDGLPGRDDGGCRVDLRQVAPRHPGREDNMAEAELVCELLAALGRAPEGGSAGSAPSIMVITPYRLQEDLLGRMVGDLKRGETMGALSVEVSTLDRCQGREADYVIISLVRGRASPFLDMPKRWNVALTRAKEGLFIVGDIESYLRTPSSTRGPSSLLSLVLARYRQQTTAARKGRQS